MERRRNYVRAPRHEVVIHPSDVEYFLWLEEFPFLHAHHLVDLTRRHEKAVYRRLNRLYHAGYIDRVRNPENYYTGAGSEPCYLVLDNKGARILEKAKGISFRDRRQVIKNLKTPPQHEETRRRRVYNLRHDMLIPSTLTAFIRATKGTTIEVWAKPTLLEKLPMQLEEDTRPFSWLVPVIHNRIPEVVPIQPDLPLALHYTELPENRNRAFLFGEIDTGSEDAYSSDLGVKSVYRMFLAYCGTWEHKLAERYFGIRNFRAAFLLPDEKRLQEIERMIKRYDVDKLPGFRPSMFIFNCIALPNMGKIYLMAGWI